MSGGPISDLFIIYSCYSCIVGTQQIFIEVFFFFTFLLRHNLHNTDLNIQLHETLYIPV